MQQRLTPSRLYAFDSQVAVRVDSQAKRMVYTMTASHTYYTTSTTCDMTESACAWPVPSET